MEYLGDSKVVLPVKNTPTEAEIKKKALEDHAQLLKQCNYRLRAYSSTFQFISWRDYNYWLTASTNTRTLKVVTYNVWFDNFNAKFRWQGLADIVHAQDPDIICFQEVTRAFLEVLVAQSWVRDKYVSSDYAGNTFQSYGVVIISKYPCRKFELHPFPSTMARALLIGVFYINGEEVAVATSHLESLANGHFRRSQLIITAELLAQYPTALFMGDFNFDATTSYNDPKQTYLENNNLKYFMPEYTDTWQHLHPDLKGYTFDTDTNAMISNYGKEIARYDRIMVKSKKWTPQSIEIIGHQELTRIDNRPILPSDHYGLVATFQYNVGLW
jgi:endonuclease/exonuclease/phosphatase family metal-dependent hydrolase